MTPSDQLDEQVACLKVEDGSVWLRQDALLAQLAPLLRPSVRQALGLWDTSANLQHPSWPHLSNLLLELGLIANVHDGQSASNGCFSLIFGATTWGPAVKFQLDASQHLDVMRAWAELASLPMTPEIAMDSRQLAAQFQALSGNVDARLADLF